MSEADIINAGISAYQAGDRKKAATLFAQVVKINPMSEQGWFLLGMSVSSAEQHEFCMQQVLALNPNNQYAKRQLGPQAAPPPPAAAAAPVPRSEPISRPVKPFIEEPELDTPPWASKPAVFTQEPPKTPTKPPVFTQEPPKEPAPTPAAVAKSPITETGKKPARKKRGISRMILYSLVASFFIGLFALGGVFFMLRDRLFPGEPVPSSSMRASPTVFVTQSLPTLMPTAVVPTPSPTALPSPLPTVAYMPGFKEIPCWLDTTTGMDVHCGYVTVPETRNGDPTDTIKLAVAVFKGRKSSQTPVMFLQGGPGAEAIKLSWSAFDALVSPFLKDRDFIVFDQRGTGLSEPALKCDEIQKTYRQDIYGLIPAGTRKLVFGNSFLACNGLLMAEGVNPSAYTTMESAADVRDILQMLGYGKVHVYGMSYGTRLAQVVMREYPEIVETAVLDSVVPVETNFFKSYPESIQNGLRTLFDACMMDVKCNTAYPSLETAFWDTYNSLNANPVTLTTSVYPVSTVTETVDGTVFLSVVLNSIKSSYFIETAPQTIYRVKNGDFSTLITAQYALPFAFEGISSGLYISMMCHEHVLATTPGELESVSAQPGISNYAWLPFYGDANDVYKSCMAWGARGPVLGENDALLSSDIPSLVITGRFDPTTPPIYGLQLVERLSKGYYFEFNNLGHVPSASDTSGCAMNTVLAFLRKPTVEPGRDCLNELGPVKFLTPYTGDPPLSMSRKDLTVISVDVPTGWIDGGDGFFVRWSSAFDITQIGAFRTRLTRASELKNLLPMSAYGYRGLDDVPVEAGTRNANGRKWMLYTAKSDNRPVDIAIAESGKNSLVIMMFSHPDEHDALYRTVFLPAVDSAE